MRALMIGLGSIGQRHTRDLRTLLGGDVEIIAYRARGLKHIVTPALYMDSGRNVENEYSIRVFASLDEALAEKPEMAFVCNPNSLHIPVAIACIRAGCDLFLEKPLSNSLDGTDQLIKTAADRQRIAMVGFQLRFHPCLRTLAETIQSAALGNLKMGCPRISSWSSRLLTPSSKQRCWGSRATWQTTGVGQTFG
ncbi:MAG: Gfo/Idh/MocA family oxidoreductase [Terracidiphilus sp.]